MIATPSGIAVNNHGTSEIVAAPEPSGAPLASNQRLEPTDRARVQSTVLSALATQTSSAGMAMIAIDTTAAPTPATAERHRRDPPGGPFEGLAE
jgi:hypothetical protein